MHIFRKYLYFYYSSIALLCNLYHIEVIESLENSRLLVDSVVRGLSVKVLALLDTVLKKVSDL